jgi:hypothetical protein
LGSRVKVHAEINDMFKSMFRTVPDRWLFNYAHVVVDPLNSADRTRRSFAFRIGAVAILAAIKWNHRISTAMWKSIRSWIIR